MTPVHDFKRLARPPRVAAAGLVSAILVAGCGGGSSAGPTVATGRGATTSTSSAVHAASTTTTGGGSSSASQTASNSGAPGALAFAECMRANGVSNFPDPQPGGGFLFNASPGVMSSPAFKAAQAKCAKLMPSGGPRPGTQTHPTAQTLAQFRRIADCMRQHGVPDFPDPRTSVPANPFGSGGTGVISDIEDVIFVFPSTINQQAPAFTQAAAVCRFPLHNH